MPSSVLRLALAAPAALLLAGLARATPAPTTPTPTRTLAARSTTFCGQWDSVETGSYTVYNNLWGEDNGSGSQCTTADSLSGSTLAWSTSWSWADGSSDVKSYANAVLSFTPAQLSAISTIPSTWDWSYSGSDIVADVAYDLFTSSSASGSDEYEIMIWLAALGGAGPISSTGSPVATPTLAGASWDLYAGYNGDVEVFSFVAAAEQTAFSGDLMDFLDYLTANEGLSTSQYLLSLGAGTEPFTGSDAVLTTTAYSVSVE
ncbi:family 12 glycosyl hydrolase [Xylariaceae sp. FL0804]|nr:family 12 glycosyl hydrolase [Xylariaceae sp. FL0804]